MKYIDMRPEILTIKKRHGKDYYFVDQCWDELLSLWGAPADLRGAFPYETDILYQKGLYQAQIKLASTHKGYWLYRLGMSTPNDGIYYAPSLWNRFAFYSKHDTRLSAIKEMQIFFMNKDQNKPEIKAILEVLRVEQTPQLELSF